MKKKILNIVLGFMFFFIGIIVGKLLNWSYFELSKEISIIDAVSLFTTIGMAIYITKILEKKVQDIRIEKELYIAKIIELESLLSSFETLIEESSIDNKKITSRIHSCRIKKNSIFGNIKDNFKKINLNEFDVLDKDVSIKLNYLKRLLTETPAERTKNPELLIKNALATFSANRIIEINTEINSIKEFLFVLKLKINSL